MPSKRVSRASTSEGKPYSQMTTAELRQATAEFDAEFVRDTFTAPTPKQRAQLARAKRKRGRPKNGLGARTISVTVERRLLAETDRLAKKLGVPRAALIAQGLRAVLVARGLPAEPKTAISK